ncbi:hypothetical protein K439DRAFT_1614512 [Ramaria rubella]|nr:hypothetical protein K439DRAFT_1614512 [Ramaria rubella]
MPPKRRLKTPAVAAGKDVSMKKFSKASATTEKYEQQLQQGYWWLRELMEVESSGTELPPGYPNLQDGQSWSCEDLKHVFDKIPTSASPWVLALFISSKCFSEEGWGLSTTWQILSAFKRCGTKCLFQYSYFGGASDDICA